MNNNQLDSELRKKKVATYTALQVLGIFAILIIGNCFDWLNMKFSFEKFLTWNFWNGVIQQVLMYSIALVIGYLGRLEKEFLKNEEYAINLNIYHTYLTKKTESFVRFVEKILNPKIQKEFYKHSIELKLYKLDKKYNRYDEFKIEYEHCIQWLANEDAKVNNYVCSERVAKRNIKKCKRYIIKRMNLETLILENTIDANARTFRDYPRINAHCFTWSIRSKKDNNASQYKVENTTGKDLFNKALVKALSVVLVSIVIGSIAADPSKNELLDQANGWAKLLIKYAIRVVSIIWSYGSGLYLGKGIFENNYLDVVNNRNHILCDYIDWKNVNNEKESLGFQTMAQILEKQAHRETKALEGSNSSNDTLSALGETTFALTEEEKERLIREEEVKRAKNEILSNFR